MLCGKWRRRLPNRCWKRVEQLSLLATTTTTTPTNTTGYSSQPSAWQGKRLRKPKEDGSHAGHTNPPYQEEPEASLLGVHTGHTPSHRRPEGEAVQNVRGCSRCYERRS